ncbi:MAG: hypothetical protein WBZ36_11510 [Candidatus Nitrosopolaris sp.]
MENVYRESPIKPAIDVMKQYYPIFFAFLFLMNPSWSHKDVNGSTFITSKNCGFIGLSFFLSYVIQYINRC